MGQQSLFHHCLPFAYLPSEASLSNRDSDHARPGNPRLQVAGLRVPFGFVVVKILHNDLQPRIISPCF